MKIHSVSVVIYGLLVFGPSIGAGAAIQVDKPEDYPRIRSIEIRGNVVTNKASILSVAGLKSGDRATPTVLATAKSNILQTGTFGMRHAGHLEDAVKFTLVEVNKTANNAKLIISVEENVVVKSIGITGNGPIPVTEVRAKVLTKPNYILNTNTLRADVERIQKLYDSKGYIANVVEEGFGIKSGVLAIPVKVGKVTKIELRGLSNTPEKLVLDTMKLHVGSYYNVNDFKADYTALNNLGKFKDIQPAIATPSPGVVDLILTFTENM